MAENFTESRIVYFFEAVRCGTIRAAADWLNVAPSAVSRQINLLEAELNAPLIERHARGVKTTAAGDMLVAYFREQLAHKDDLVSQLQELRGLKTGQVNVVLGEGFVSDVLAGPMVHFCSQYPGIRVNLDLAGTNEVVRKISEDESEIGLVYNPPAEMKIVSRAVQCQPMMAVVGPNFPVHAVAKNGMSIREFATYPLAATYPSYGTRQLLQAAAASEKIILEPILASNSMAILKQFVKAGLGVTCLPEFAVTSELRAGEVQVVAIDHPLLKSGEAHVITRVGRKLSVASNRMLQLMMAHMRAFRP